MDEKTLSALAFIATNNKENERVSLDAVGVIVKETSPEAKESLIIIMKDYEARSSVRNLAAKHLGVDITF